MHKHISILQKREILITPLSRDRAHGGDDDVGRSKVHKALLDKERSS